MIHYSGQHPVVKATTRQLAFRLWAVGALLIFFSGWLAVPVAFALPEPVECGMQCCIMSGHCCCFASRQAARHEGHAHGQQSEQEPIFDRVSQSCQPGCATLPSSSVDLSLNKSCREPV